MQGKQFEASLYEKLHGTNIIVGSLPHGMPTNIVLSGLFVVFIQIYSDVQYPKSDSGQVKCMFG